MLEGLFSLVSIAQTDTPPTRHFGDAPCSMDNSTKSRASRWGAWISSSYCRNGGSCVLDGTAAQQSREREELLSTVCRVSVRYSGRYCSRVPREAFHIHKALDGCFYGYV